LKTTAREITSGLAVSFNESGMDVFCDISTYGADADLVDMYYDAATGDCAGTKTAGVLGSYMSGAATSQTQSGVIEVVISVTNHVTSGFRIHNDGPLTVNTASGTVSSGSIGLGYDLTIVKLPDGFGARRKKTMEQRLADMEKQLLKVELKDCKYETDVKAVFANSKLERTRRIVAKQQQLQSVIAGDISPTESLAGWVDSSLPKKLGLLKTDQKDEKDRKGKG